MQTRIAKHDGDLIGIMADLDWLFSRPIAHRGLHERAVGIIENTLSAAKAAAEGGFAVECDVQLSADGEAMVFHDHVLDRLTAETGPVGARGAAELSAIAIAGSNDRIPTLTNLLDLLAGQAPLVVEVKSRFDGDLRLAARVAEMLSGRRDPVAVKSFDPDIVTALRRIAPGIPRGVVAQSRYDEASLEALGPDRIRQMTDLLHWERTRPDFLSWRLADLPAAGPHLGRLLAGTRVMTWTVRSAADAEQARRHADQIVFEGFHPQADASGSASLPRSDGALQPSAIDYDISASPLSEIDASAWDACANPAGTRSTEAQHETYNPFVSHAFLSALEDSGCASARSGWAPAHVAVKRPDGTLAAAAPCYLKSHSMGEYVFDGGWADAYERAGGRYYPKLQVSVPFTPVTGPRLLVAPGSEAEEARATLVAGLEALRRQTEASSTHLTFLPESDAGRLAEQGYLVRTGEQFHWLDEGYDGFEGFLSALTSRKRKAIRRERRDALANDITVERLTGTDIREAHWDAFLAFYLDTGSRKWGRPYLNRRFFSLLGERMADRVLLVMAKRAGRYVAGAINLIGDVALYGRNWGCIENHPFLHFEVCYYQAIDFALERNLARVEAGAQGEHKLARGYRPVTTYSAHAIADPGLKRAIAAYLERERSYVAAAHQEYDAAMPFRQAEGEEQE